MTDTHHHDPDHEPGAGSHAGCPDALAALYEYLDGELTEERRVRIQSHLDDCNPCFEAYDFEAELRLVVRERCRDEVPHDLQARIGRLLAETDGADAG